MKALRVLRGGEVGASLAGRYYIAAKAAATAKVLLGLLRIWTVARGAIVPCRRLPVTLRKTIGVAGLTCCPSLTSRGRMLTDGVDSLIRDSNDKARWPAIRHPDEDHDHRPQHRYAIACGSLRGRSKESACLSLPMTQVQTPGIAPRWYQCYIRAHGRSSDAATPLRNVGVMDSAGCAAARGRNGVGGTTGPRLRAV